MFSSGNWAAFVVTIEVVGKMGRSLGLSKGRFSELLGDELWTDD